jgi:tetratricopeptide (TPR) repeat protein
MLTSLTLCLTLLGASPQSAPSGPPAGDAAVKKEARALFDAGTALFAKRRYAEALAKFEATKALRPHPTLQFNIGKCQEQLGHTSEALFAYREYLRLVPSASDREAVFSSIARLERTLRDQGLQQLTVLADQPAARVLVDEVELGPAPATAALPVGAHRVRVVAEGFEPFEKAVLLELVQPVEVAVSLQPRAPAPPVISAEVDAPKVEPVRPPEPIVLTPTPTPVVTAPKVAVVPPARSPRVWTWVVGGLALAGAATGAGLLGASWGDAQQLTQSAPSRSKDTANSLYGSVQNTWLGSTIAFAAAGVSAVAAVILFFLEQ